MIGGMKTAAEQPRALTRKERSDLRVLALFTGVYCHARHAGEKSPLSDIPEVFDDLGMEKYPLCTECREFLKYALMRRLYCPLDPKPLCKDCSVHCFKVGHRERVREIMRFSGRHLILRGRLDLLWHYWF